MYFTRAENENCPLQETQWLYLFSGEGGDFVFFFQGLTTPCRCFKKLMKKETGAGGIAWWQSCTLQSMSMTLGISLSSTKTVTVKLS